MNRHLAHALALADAAYRDHLARGGAAWGTGALGQGLPGSAALPSAPHAMGMLPGGIQPVLSPNIQHGLLRHALKMRPHYDDGGSEGGGGEGEGAGGDGGSDNGYGAGLGGYGIGASAGFGGFGIGGFGGDVGSVSNAPVGSASNPGTGYGGSNAPSGSASNPGGGYGIGGFGGAVGSVSSGSSDKGSDNSDSGFSGYGGLGGTTTMGRTSDSVAGLGSTSTGYSYSGRDSGGGDIGPSGVATGGGFGGGAFGSSNTSAGGIGAFGNFGSSSLSDGDGLRGAENYGYGVGQSGTDGLGGYSSFHAGNDANFGSYGLNGVGNMGATDAGSTGASESPYGSLNTGAFSLNDVSSTLADAGSLSPRQAIFGNFGAGSTSDTGVIGNAGLSNYTGPGDNGGIASIAPYGLAGTQMPGEALGVTNAIPGFDNFAGADQGLTPSRISSAGYSPNAQGWGAGFGSGFGSGDDATAATGDPARALTVHGLSPIGAAFGSFAGADEGLRGNIGSYTPGTLGTLTGPSSISDPTRGTLGFDNLGAYSPAIGSIAGIGTAPTGYSPAAELANEVRNPDSYFNNPSLVGKQVTPAGLAGLLGNFSVESNGYGYGDPITGTQASIVPGAVGPNGDLGIAQDVGVRKAALLGALGFAPGTTANAASPQMAGTLADQIGFNLGDAFSHPSMYGPTISALTAPGYSPADAALTIAKNFEAPASLQGDIGPIGQQTLANRVAAANQLAGAFAAAQAASNQAYANNIGSIGVPGLDSGMIGGDVASQVAAAPTTSYGDDVRQALAMRAAQHTDDQPTGALSMGGFSGLDSVSDADWANEASKLRASTPASDIAAADAADAAARVAQQQVAAAPSAFDSSEGLSSLTAADVARMAVDPTYGGVSTPEVEAYKAALMGLPAGSAYNNAQEAASVTGFGPLGFRSGTALSGTGDPTAAAGDPTSITPAAAASLPDAPTYHDPDAPDPTAAPAVTSTPAYFPGEKSVIKTIANAVTGLVPGVGVANAISALLGGPNVGSYLTDHSSPGEPAQPSGNGNSHDNVAGLGTYSFVLPNGQRAAVQLTPGDGSSSSTPTLSAAQQAYITALNHQTGPAARKANPVPLIAPQASTSSVYNPLEDPSVRSALAAAGVF